MRVSRGLLVQLSALVVAVGLAMPASSADIFTCLVSSVVLSPSDRPGEARKLDLVRDARGRVVLRDRVGGGSVRRTPITQALPNSIVRGAVAIGTDAQGWLALSAGDGFVDLYGLGNVSAGGALTPEVAASVAVGPDFDPDSIRLGIIAVLIGLAREPVELPALTIADGTSNTLMLWNGSKWLILPHIEQDN